MNKKPRCCWQWMHFLALCKKRKKNVLSHKYAIEKPWPLRIFFPLSPTKGRRQLCSSKSSEVEKNGKMLSFSSSSNTNWVKEVLWSFYFLLRNGLGKSESLGFTSKVFHTEETTGKGGENIRVRKGGRKRQIETFSSSLALGDFWFMTLGIAQSQPPFFLSFFSFWISLKVAATPGDDFSSRGPIEGLLSDPDLCAISSRLWRGRDTITGKKEAFVCPGMVSSPKGVRNSQRERKEKMSPIYSGGKRRGEANKKSPLFLPTTKEAFLSFLFPLCSLFLLPFLPVSLRRPHSPLPSHHPKHQGKGREEREGGEKFSPLEKGERERERQIEGSERETVGCLPPSVHTDKRTFFCPSRHERATVTTLFMSFFLMSNDILLPSAVFSLF